MDSSLFCLRSSRNSFIRMSNNTHLTWNTVDSFWKQNNEQFISLQCKFEIGWLLQKSILSWSLHFLISFIFYHRTEIVVNSESDIDVLTTNVNEVGFFLFQYMKVDAFLVCSSPALKGQLIFFDHLLSVVRLSICKLFIFLSSSQETLSKFQPNLA